MAVRPAPERAYTLGLLVLTIATGAVDGVSYLALDRVFTGNMTGNVLFIGFGLVGVDDIPVLNNLVALLTFMLGAVLGARLVGRSALGLSRRSLLLVAVNAVLVLVLAAVWLAVGRLSTPLLLVVTGVLALLLGAQAAAVKTTGIRDLSTVVVTMTMVNLSTDSRLAGGAGTSWSRRLLAVVTMGLGALLAALVIRFTADAWALVLAGVVMLVGAVLLGRARGIDGRTQAMTEEDSPASIR